MYGFGAPGAVVNYVTKKPTDTPTRSVSLGYGSSSLVRANADLGGARREWWPWLPPERTRRARDDRHGGDLERSSMLLALDAKLSDRLSWDFQTLYQDRLGTDTEPTIRRAPTGSALPATVKNDQKLVGAGSYTDNKFGHVATGLKYSIKSGMAGADQLQP